LNSLHFFRIPPLHFKGQNLVFFFIFNYLPPWTYKDCCHSYLLVQVN
jgi:hypothetical protein